MCNQFFYLFSHRSKPETSIFARRNLKKLFKELANRSNSYYIDRELFLRLSHLPGLLGEQVFNALDEDEDNKLDVKEFVQGICTIYEGQCANATDFLFKVFNFTRNGQINRQDIRCIWKYLPNTCQKCLKSFSPEWDFEECLEKLFEDEKFLLYECFHDKVMENKEFGEHLLRNILAYLPEVFEMVFVGIKSEVSGFGSVVQYKGREYFAVLKCSSIFLSRFKGARVNGIILVSDLFLDDLGAESFGLKNGKFLYEFKCLSAQEKKLWMEHLANVTMSRDISKDYGIMHDVIGKGAYGKVKLAQCLNSNDLVAVKIIYKEPLDLRSATRLRREMSILRICHHPNIVALKDIYETSEKIYIVTEYVQGGSLFAWIKKLGFRVQESLAKVIIYQITNAIGYLHSLGICHRDIKLENILLDTSSGVKPKIIDFGLSCILGPGQFSQEAVGTLKYASPELISRIPYRETPDIWGIGVIIYILLTGKIPFYGENDQEIANRILKKKIDVENERWAGISKEAKDLVLRLLTRKVSERIKISEILQHKWFEGFDLSKINTSELFNT